ncbi:hypothetical protein FACS189415_7380 [Bacteroidia bacterium]|nr:hypothetical protein FACS189415_7380 [Bacteroidia bacterium]
MEALEEAVANSVYHRSYDIREPIEIRILPNAIEIINQGGPDRSAKLDDVKKGIIHNQRYRNRRIGDFLKELNMTEGRGTGIPTIRKEMAKNGSPEPIFETGEDYSYFITTLPIHPAFLSDDGVNDDVNDGAKTTDNQINKIYLLIRDGVSDGVSDGVNDGVNDIVNILLNVSGLNASEIAQRINKSIPSVERYLRSLRKKGIIEFRGVPKTGGYHLTDKAKDKLK